MNIIIAIGIYVYLALALHTIAKKLDHKKFWLAWIPIGNIILMLQLAEYPWTLILLMLIFIIPRYGVFYGNIVFAALIILTSQIIFKKRGYAGGLALTYLILPVYFVIFGLVAWSDKKDESNQK